MCRHRSVSVRTFLCVCVCVCVHLYAGASLDMCLGTKMTMKCQAGFVIKPSIHPFIQHVLLEHLLHVSHHASAGNTEENRAHGAQSPHGGTLNPGHSGEGRWAGAVVLHGSQFWSLGPSLKTRPRAGPSNPQKGWSCKAPHFSSPTSSQASPSGPQR